MKIKAPLEYRGELAVIFAGMAIVSVVIILVFILTAMHAFAAVTRVGFTQAVQGNTPTNSYSAPSFTPSSDTLLVVEDVWGTPFSPSVPSYNGSAMTLIGQSVQDGNTYARAYGLMNPGSAQTVSYTVTGNGLSTAVVYQGVSALPTNFAVGHNQTGATLNLGPLTLANSSSWVAGVYIDNGVPSGPVSPLTSFSTAGGGSEFFFDTNSAVSSPFTSSISQSSQNLNSTVIFEIPTTATVAPKNFTQFLSYFFGF